MLMVLLEELYDDEQRIHDEKLRYKRMKTGMIEYFGHEAEGLFSAPGRCEIIGNHTDHNGGKVIAASIDMDTIAAAAPNGTRLVRLKSEGYDEVVVDIDDVINNPYQSCMSRRTYTERLAAGMIEAVHRMGYKIEGFDACITSNVVPSAGVSSSASFEMLVCAIINDLFNGGNISIKECARIGQYAENVYWRKKSGLMDQIACAAGGTVYMDFSAKNDVSYESFKLPLDEEGYTIILTNTGKGHADLSEEYSAIPKEMYEVAGILGKKRLCETSKQELLANIDKFGDNDRALLRALHFYNENERVEYVYESCKVEDALNKIQESGHSSWELLQNCHCAGEYKEQKITLALALAREYDKCGVSRVHGGGFAGVIMTITKADEADEYMRKMAAVFGKDSVHRIKIRKYGAVKIKEAG